LGILSPERSVNQLDRSTYAEADVEIIESLALYEDLKNALDSAGATRMVRMAAALQIFNLEVRAYRAYCQDGYFNAPHAKLRASLSNMINLLRTA
jgi:hypothetical protein